MHAYSYGYSYSGTCMYVATCPRSMILFKYSLVNNNNNNFNTTLYVCGVQLIVIKNTFALHWFALILVATFVSLIIIFTEQSALLVCSGFTESYKLYNYNNKKQF